MRVGMIARCDDSGLGNQTFEFYRHMRPSKVMVIDFRDYNPLPQYPERYPDAWRVVRGFPKAEDCDALLDDIDVLFTCEIPYNYYLFEAARKRGVKTVLQYNWEFLDYLQDPTKPMPDLFAAPTSWMLNTLPQRIPDANVKMLRVPVARDRIKPRDIKYGCHFVHVIGRAAHADRNGTRTFMEALKYTRKPMDVTVYAQEGAPSVHQTMDLPATVNFVVKSGNLEHYEDLYKEGSVLVLPRRYGGLCLPMQEALAAGMPVIMPDIAPNRDLLPGHWCVQANIKDSFMARTEINVYEASAKDLARRMDWFATISKSMMRKQNIIALHMADTISWDAMKPEYERTFEELCRK